MSVGSSSSPAAQLYGSSLCSNGESVNLDIVQHTAANTGSIATGPCLYSSICATLVGPTTNTATAACWWANHAAIAVVLFCKHSGHSHKHCRYDCTTPVTHTQAPYYHPQQTHCNKTSPHGAHRNIQQAVRAGAARARLADTVQRGVCCWRSYYSAV